MLVRGNKIYRRIIEIEQSYIEGTIYSETESRTPFYVSECAYSIVGTLYVFVVELLTEYVATSKSRSEGYYKG